MVKRMLWIAWACCWAMGCGGQDSGPEPSDREAAAVASGVFLHGDVMFCTGSPAVVELRLVEGTTVVARAYTNTAGRYGFFDLFGDPASYRIQVLVNNKVAHTHLLGGLAAGDEVPTIILGPKDCALAAPPFLYGEVVWSTGTPANAVELRLVQGDTVMARAYSNSAGLYGFFDLSGDPSGVELQLLVNGAVRQAVSLDGLVGGGEVPTITLD